MNRLNFLTDKQKQILGIVASVIVIACFFAPGLPGLAEPTAKLVTQWADWVKGAVAVVSLFLGIQVFNPSSKELPK